MIYERKRDNHECDQNLKLKDKYLVTKLRVWFFVCLVGWLVWFGSVFCLFLMTYRHSINENRRGKQQILQSKREMMVMVMMMIMVMMITIMTLYHSRINI